MKQTCNRCRRLLERDQFALGGGTTCKACKAEYQREYYSTHRQSISEQRSRRRSTADGKKSHRAAATAAYERMKSERPERFLLNIARRRAAEKGVPFDLREADISIPLKCPILGIALAPVGAGCVDASPTLDRIIPSAGYVRGNVVVMSHRANTIKSFGSLEEHEAVVRWLRSLAQARAA